MRPIKPPSSCDDTSHQRKRWSAPTPVGQFEAALRASLRAPRPSPRKPAADRRCPTRHRHNESMQSSVGRTDPLYRCTVVPPFIVNVDERSEPMIQVALREKFMVYISAVQIAIEQFVEPVYRSLLPRFLFDVQRHFLLHTETQYRHEIVHHQSRSIVTTLELPHSIVLSEYHQRIRIDRERMSEQCVLLTQQEVLVRNRFRALELAHRFQFAAIHATTASRNQGRTVAATLIITSWHRSSVDRRALGSRISSFSSKMSQLGQSASNSDAPSSVVTMEMYLNVLCCPLGRGFLARHSLGRKRFLSFIATIQAWGRQRLATKKSTLCESQRGPSDTGQKIAQVLIIQSFACYHQSVQAVLTKLHGLRVGECDGALRRIQRCGRGCVSRATLAGFQRRVLQSSTVTVSREAERQVVVSGEVGRPPSAADACDVGSQTLQPTLVNTSTPSSAATQTDPHPTQENGIRALQVAPIPPPIHRRNETVPKPISLPLCISEIEVSREDDLSYQHFISAIFRVRRHLLIALQAEEAGCRQVILDARDVAFSSVVSAALSDWTDGKPQLHYLRLLVEENPSHVHLALLL